MPRLETSTEQVAGAGTSPDPQEPETAALLSEIVGSPVAQLERIGGGRNSRVYRVVCEHVTTYAAKFYFRRNDSDLERLEAEFSALGFLWDNEIECVPQPILADRNHNCGIYEYIEGETLSGQDVTQREIELAVNFLRRLHRLRDTNGSLALPPAKEARFSALGIVENIGVRLDRLNSVSDGDSQYAVLREFLITGFQPAFREITDWCRTSLEASPVPFDMELPLEYRTLSPSDFGFHNAVKRNESQIVFLDFEYFGWDDPAKMICDFLMHPAAGLPKGLRMGFVKDMVDGLDDGKYLAERVQALYPLIGLKWCMILLNEFLPESQLRHGFLGGSKADIGAVQTEQLEKAKSMLARTEREYKRFPYYD